MKTNSFTPETVPKDVQIEVDGSGELRCPHYHPKLGRICNRLLCKGEASTKPQQFKCSNCGNLTTFVKR